MLSPNLDGISVGRKTKSVSLCVNTHAHMSIQSCLYTITIRSWIQPKTWTWDSVSASLHTGFEHSTSKMMMSQSVLQDLSWLETLLSKCHTQCHYYAVSHITCGLHHVSRCVWISKIPMSTFVIHLFDALFTEGSDCGGETDSGFRFD